MAAKFQTALEAIRTAGREHVEARAIEKITDYKPSNDLGPGAALDLMESDLHPTLSLRLEHTVSRDITHGRSDGRLLLPHVQGVSRAQRPRRAAVQAQGAEAPRPPHLSRGGGGFG